MGFPVTKREPEDDTMQAARLHAYTDDVSEALSIYEVNTVAERLERGEIDGRAVIKPP